MFAVGRSKYAPGTVASFITCLVFIPLYGNKINIIFLIIIISFFFIYSVYAIDKSVNYFDTIDAKEIVVDEFIGQSIPILTFYNYIQVNNFGDFIPARARLDSIRTGMGGEPLRIRNLRTKRIVEMMMTVISVIQIGVGSKEIIPSRVF